MTDFSAVSGGRSDDGVVAVPPRRGAAATISEPGGRLWAFALALGLISTTFGALVSTVVPGRGFLAVWAIVTLALTLFAAWKAERLRALASALVERRSGH